MDKLKQNAFWIGVGGVAVVLVALAYVLVVRPLGSLGELNASVDDLKKKVTKDATRKDPQGKPGIATRDYEKWLVARMKADEDARDQVKDWYDALGQGFDAYLDGFSQTPPQADEFAARYKDEVEKLLKAYREKHKIAEVSDKPEEMLPKVDMVGGENINETNVPSTMKELWIILTVFEAVNKLELGGLKEISFSGRGNADKETPPPYNRWMDVKVGIELPFSRVEDLLTELYASTRVPFQLEELECRKVPESLSQFMAIHRTKKVKDNAGYEGVSYDAEVPDPPVHCDISLAAFDWTGLPAETAAEETADEGDADAKGDKKTGKGGSNKTKKPKG